MCGVCGVCGVCCECSVTGQTQATQENEEISESDRLSAIEAASKEALLRTDEVRPGKAGHRTAREPALAARRPHRDERARKPSGAECGAAGACPLAASVLPLAASASAAAACSASRCALRLRGGRRDSSSFRLPPRVGRIQRPVGFCFRPLQLWVRFGTSTCTRLPK